MTRQKREFVSRAEARRYAAQRRDRRRETVKERHVKGHRELGFIVLVLIVLAIAVKLWLVPVSAGVQNEWDYMYEQPPLEGQTKAELIDYITQLERDLKRTIRVVDKLEGDVDMMQDIIVERENCG